MAAAAGYGIGVREPCAGPKLRIGGDFRFKRPLDVCESVFGPETTSKCRVSLESNQWNFLSLNYIE